jgi:hypothetical protein
VRDFAQQLQQIGTAGSQNGVDCVSGQAFQEAESYAVVTLKMADLRFHLTAALASLLPSSCQPASTAAGQMNSHFALLVVPAITCSVDAG